MHGYSFQHFIIVKTKLTAPSISDYIVFILCENKGYHESKNHVNNLTSQCL